MKFHAQFQNITIITICCRFDRTLKSGTFGILGWSCWDVGQHGTNLGHPGKSRTGGNPTALSTVNTQLQLVRVDVGADEEGFRGLNLLKLILQNMYSFKFL